MSISPQPSQIFIRNMTLADVPQVEALDQRNFSQPWPKGSFAYELRPDSFSICLVAIDETQPESENICGLIVAWRIVDSLEIGTITVQKEYRHLGVGRNLMAYALTLSEGFGVVDALLEVRASNADALRLYYGMGFEAVGLRPGYYEDNNEDAILLKLSAIQFEQIRNLISLKYV